MNGNFFRGVLLACWLLAAVISLNHLYEFSQGLSEISTKTIGILGWIIAGLGCLIYARGHYRSVIMVAILFFGIGFYTGPFLEPPADPLEHLRRIHELTCWKKVSDLSMSNRGLWHYSMAGAVLCVDKNNRVNPQRMLLKVDIVNGLFWALGSAVLFILGVQSGLSPRWSFLSLLICFLFFGTNRFSYFRYYSLAPTFTSLCLVWFWIALFFFKKKVGDIVKGSALALSALPVLWVNHNQEAVFLVLIVIFWLGITGFEIKKPVLPAHVLHYFPSWATHFFSFRWILFFWVVLTGWILPQSTSFLHWLSQFFTRGSWPHHQFSAVEVAGWYIGGKIAGVRVMDTAGYVLFVVLCLAIPYLFLPSMKRGLDNRLRIFILAVIPFIVYFTPFLHFIWASNVRGSEYYRICYASVYWLFFAHFLSGIERGICGWLSRNTQWPGNGGYGGMR